MLQLHGEDRAIYIFATSAYRDRDHFINTANENKDAAMRDFATRIEEEHWVILPDLYTVPEQKFLVTNKLLKKILKEIFKKNIPDKIVKRWSVGWMMNLSIGSIRKIIQEVDKEKKKEELQETKLNTLIDINKSLWPKWAIDLIEKML